MPDNSLELVRDTIYPCMCFIKLCPSTLIAIEFQLLCHTLDLAPTNCINKPFTLRNIWYCRPLADYVVHNLHLKKDLWESCLKSTCLKVYCLLLPLNTVAFAQAPKVLFCNVSDLHLLYVLRISNIV
jgi:hypothetical protein